MSSYSRAGRKNEHSDALAKVDLRPTCGHHESRVKPHTKDPARSRLHVVVFVVAFSSADFATDWASRTTSRCSSVSFTVMGCWNTFSPRPPLPQTSLSPRCSFKPSAEPQATGGTSKKKKVTLGRNGGVRTWFPFVQPRYYHLSFTNHPSQESPLSTKPDHPVLNPAVDRHATHLTPPQCEPLVGFLYL